MERYWTRTGLILTRGDNMNIIFKSLVYDFLYIAADQLIKKYDPCQIYKDASGEAICIRDSPSKCCRGCRYLGPDECITKCLACKLGLCSAAVSANQKLNKSLGKMRAIACNYRVYRIRMPKREIFNCLKRSKYMRKHVYKIMGA